jgi:hypothetical protein
MLLSHSYRVKASIELSLTIKARAARHMNRRVSLGG